MTVRPDLITEVVQHVRKALSPYVDADWSVPARDLEWSCRETAVHMADSYFAQAGQLVARPPDRWVAAEVRAMDDAGPERLLEVIDTCAELLRFAGANADPAVRAWHPDGMSDPSGWLAMGVVEGLAHTWDIGSTLGSDWRPPAELCAPAIERLFPGAPDGDPADVLLWCTGRIALPDRPRQRTWQWDPSVRP